MGTKMAAKCVERLIDQDEDDKSTLMNLLTIGLNSKVEVKLLDITVPILFFRQSIL